MPEIKTFVFNPFQVNTYILSDDDGKCAVIDAACYGKAETDALMKYIDENQLTPVCLINTHAHVDHLPGISALRKRFGIPFMMHRDGLPVLHSAVDQGKMFGFSLEQPRDPDHFIAEGDVIPAGNLSLEVLHVPGHSPGSVVFVDRDGKRMMTGDVLFSGSIGRTDLPGGDFDTLITGIQTKVMPFDDDYQVYPGHGPSTSIGKERKNNPFLQ